MKRTVEAEAFARKHGFQIGSRRITYDEVEYTFFEGQGAFGEIIFYTGVKVSYIRGRELRTLQIPIFLDTLFEGLEVPGGLKEILLRYPPYKVPLKLALREAFTFMKETNSCYGIHSLRDLWDFCENFEFITKNTEEFKETCVEEFSLILKDYHGWGISIRDRSIKKLLQLGRNYKSAFNTFVWFREEGISVFDKEFGRVLKLGYPWVPSIEVFKSLKRLGMSFRVMIDCYQLYKKAPRANIVFKGIEFRVSILDAEYQTTILLAFLDRIHSELRMKSLYRRLKSNEKY